MSVNVVIRNPFPPHEVRAQTRSAGELAYGFQLGRPTNATFKISRADVNDAYLFALGAMVTLERDDNVLPWVGFITTRRLSLADPTVSVTCRDLAGALFDRARTAKDWGERTLAAGEFVRQVFQEAEQRAEPPLLVRLPQSPGPNVSYTVKAESLLNFLTRVADLADWEWWLTPRVSRSQVAVDLEFGQSAGIDRRNEVAFEPQMFNECEIAEDAEGFLRAALTVGGSGTFSDRVAVQVTRTGRADPTIDAETAAVPSDGDSPALAGTAVLVEPAVSNKEALAAASRRRHFDPKLMRERLTLHLVESRIDMAKIELGSIYRVRFKDIDLGLGYEEVIRCLALDLNESGIIHMTAEVVRDGRT